MADIGGPPAALDLALRPPAPILAAAARRRALAVGKLEAQRAGYGVGFRQPQWQALPEREERAGILADQPLASLVIAEILGAEIADGHEPVAADPLDRREETEILH